MRKFIVVIFSFCISVSVLHADEPQSHRMSWADAPTRLYFEAFHEGNLAKLKQATTAQFQSHASDAKWEAQLKDGLPRYRTAQFELIDPELNKTGGTAGIRFVFKNGGEKGQETVWVQLTHKDAEMWKIDKLIKPVKVHLKPRSKP